MDPGSRVHSPWVQAQYRQSLIQPQRGAACQCWLGTWPHDPCLGTAGCCWLGPCSTDPLRCGLNSSSTNVTALRNLSQFAKSLRGARCCLASALLGNLTFCPGSCVPPLFSWLGATVGRGGVPKFSSRPFLPSGMLHSQPAVFQATRRSSHGSRLKGAQPLG